MSRCCKKCDEAEGQLPRWPADDHGTNARSIPPRGLEHRYQLTQRGWIEALGISSAIAES